MSRTILLVDDSSVDRVMLNGFLKSEYSILEATSGEEALKILNTKYKIISVIIMDLMMPGMGGYETLKKIKANPLFSPIPVIIATGLDDAESHEKAIAYGADNFITKPYNRLLLLNVVKNAIKLRETSVIVNTVWRDRLTGLLSRDAFFTEAERMIKRHDPEYYILSCFNIENFKIINDQYGKKIGDIVLKYIGKCLSEFVDKRGGIACRHSNDLFSLLYPASLINSAELKETHHKTMNPTYLISPLRIRIGRYFVIDKSVPIDIMFDRASLAESTIKNRFDTYIADYTEDMREALLSEQKIVNNMSEALENGEFEPWFQPQYNHATGALIGAEALVRWKKDGNFISPAQFVPVFERNGFIYEMDKYIWEQVCILLRRWIDEGKDPLPVSINISRRDMQHDQCISTITDLVEKYKIPVDLLRLEITESAMTENSIIDKVGELIKLGFTIEIDDFGSGYSSLNTLKDVPAQILKLDMRFFETSNNAQRAGNIIESIIRMAKWLGMAVIAEGVEEKAQADYLKSIGCYYIQGYFYAKPMMVTDYEKRLEEKNREPHLSRLQTIENLDNNLFWDPKSMETLIFNSYVGGACIFEYSSIDQIEILRVNDQYISEFGGLLPENAGIKDCSVISFLDAENLDKLYKTIQKADKTNKEASCEVTISNGTHTEYVRYTTRVIARNTERILYYAVMVNETELREAERKQKESTERLSIVMDNVNGGVSALQIFDDGTSNVLFHNDKYYELFGYTHQQAEAIHFDTLSCILPESFPSVMQKVQKLKKDGIPVIIDYAITKKDGSVAYIRANCSLMDMAGYGQVITSVLVDVSEQRTLQDQLRAIVDNINGGVTALRYNNGKPEFLLINDNYYEIIGYTKEQFETEIDDVFTLVHPDDRERISKLVSNVTKKETAYTMEYRIIRRNGAVRHILCNTSIIHLFGIKELVQLSVINDITALREAQIKEKNLSVQMNTIMENIKGGITATVLQENNKIEIIFANDGYYKLFGYTQKQFELEVSNVFDLIIPEDYQKTVETVVRIVRERTPETYEYQCRRRDGSIIYVQTTNAVISMEGVGNSVFLAVTTDITELRRVEEKSREWADRLQAVMNSMTNGITAITFKNNQIQYLFANDRYCQIHGVQDNQDGQEKLRNVLNTIDPDDRQRIKDYAVNTNKIGDSYETEYRVNLADGTVRYVKISLNVTKLLGIDEPVQVAIYTDITAEKKASTQLQFLNTTAHDIITEVDTDKAINETMVKICNYFKSDNAYIIEVDLDNLTTTNTYEYCKEGVVPQIEYLQNIPFETTETWYKTLSNNEFLVISDVPTIKHDDTKFHQILREQKVKTLIAAPLFRNGEFIGFIGVDNPRDAMDQVKQLTALADYVTILLNRRDVSKKIEHDTKAVQQLMDDTPGGFLRMAILPDKSPTIVSFNDSLCQLLSMTREDIIKAYGDNALKCLVDEDMEAIKSDSAKALASSGQLTSKCRLRRLDGKVIWVMLFGRYIRDENNKTFLNTYFTNITEKQTEEENQKALLDNFPFGAAMYDFDGTKLSVIHINKKYWQLVGREPVEYNNTSVIDMVHPDDKQIVMQEILSAIRQNRGIVADMRIKNGGDGYIPFHITGTIITEGNGKYTLYICYDQISDETMSLQEMLPIALSTIVSNTEDMSYVKDKDLRYICVSQSIADIVGAKNPRDLIGKTAEEVFSEMFADKFSADDKNVIENGETVLRALEHIPTPDGGICLARTSKFPILNSKGEAVGVYCISCDITAQKEKESQLELLTASIPGGLAAYSISDEGFRTLYFNDGYYDFSGYTREEYVKMTEKEPLALMHPEDRPTLLAMVHAFAKDKKDGMKGECSYRCVTRDGAVHYMSMKAVLSQVGEKHFVLNAVQLDITTQVLAKNKQIELLDNLPFGAGMYEFDGKNLKNIHVNKQFQKIVGRIKTNSDSVYPISGFIHPDDIKIALDEINDAIVHNRNVSCVLRIICGSGEYRPLRIEGTLQNQNNGKYVIFVAFSRISQEEQNFENMLPHLFDTIMESSTDLAFVKDVNFRYIRCSKTFADILGLDSEKSVIGKTDYELFSKEAADSFRRDDSTLFADGKPQIDVDEAIPAPDGTLHYTRTSKHLLRDTAGNMIGIYCIGRDITDVREAFSHLKLLTNTIPGGIATFRCMPGKIESIYFSDGISTLGGYTREEFQSKVTPLDLILSEDKEIIHQQIELLKNGETMVDCTFRICTKDGVYKWINASGNVTERVGDTFTVSTVLIDVTESQNEKERLRRTEEEYRIAASHRNRVICRYLIKEQTLVLTEESSKLLNYPLVLTNIPYGKENLATIYEDTRANYLEFYEKIKQGEKECSVCFRKLIDNNWYWLEARATTVFDEFGKPFSAVISFMDITEQREKEAIYSRWQNSLFERPDESYTLFRANLSKGVSFESRSGSLLDIDFADTGRSFNELTAEYIEKKVYADDRERYRAFLNANTMLAEYMRGHRSDSIEYREFMPDGTIRWLKLSVDLVKYPDSDDVEVYLMYENIDVKKKSELQTIERAETDALTGLLNRSAFAVRVNQIIGASSQGVHHALFMMDVDNFKQVNDVFGHGAGDEVLTDIATLLTKATSGEDLVGRPGGDEFVVFLSNISGENEAEKKARKLCEITRKIFNVGVRISTSIGIAMYPNDGEGFESLYKTADESLYRVKDEGKDGYSFSTKEPVTELEIHRGKDSLKQATKDKNKQRRMLVVDDSELDREIMSGLFKENFIVEQAADGVSALEVLRHYGTAISVVLLDLVMPGMDGYEVLHKIQGSETTRTVPVIIVSADENRETTLKVIHAGATDLIAKPVDPELLRIRVEAAISRTENERLRAINSFLSLRNTQTGSFRAALEYSGIIVITLNWQTNEFLYCPGIETRLAGRYDERSLWSILNTDMVTDAKTVQKMQEIVHELSADHDLKDDGCSVRLKTPSGLSHMFDFRVFRDDNDDVFADKMIITLRDKNAKNA